MPYKVRLLAATSVPISRRFRNIRGSKHLFVGKTWWQADLDPISLFNKDEAVRGRGREALFAHRTDPQQHVGAGATGLINR